MSTEIPAATGWAIVQNGEIMMATVSPTRIAALVNGLLVVFGVAPRQHWADGRVEEEWNFQAAQKSKQWSGGLARVAVNVIGADG